MASLTDLTKLQTGVFYKEHPTRKRDAANKDRQWVIQQKFDGKRKTSTLGWQKLDGISQGDAINKANFYKANHKWNFENPSERQRPICKADEIAENAAKVAAEKAEAEDNLSVAELIERYLEEYVDRRLADRTAKEYRRICNIYVIPIIGHHRCLDVKKRHIFKLVNDVSKETPTMGNRVLATIKGLFTFAVDADLIQISPAAGMKQPAPDVAKDFFLHLPEVANMFKVLESQDNRDTADILRLITLTGLRPGEICKMRRGQIKTEIDGTWLELKAVDTKNKRSHRTFLSSLAVSIIESRIEDLNLSTYIFPARTKTGFIRSDVLVNRVHRIQPLMQENEIDKFTAHDLRTTAATGISKLGHSAIVPDILGHKPQGVTRKHYDFYSREPEIKRALEAWELAIINAMKEQSADIIQLPVNS